MQVNKKIGLMGGVVLLSIIIVSFLKQEDAEAKPEEVIKEKNQKITSIKEEAQNPIQISMQPEKMPTPKLSQLIESIKENPCQGEFCGEVELEDTAEPQPEGMLIKVQVDNAFDSRAIVSSQLCSVYASVDQDDFVEFEIFQSCDLFVYKMDGAFRSYTEEHFVEYVSGSEAELSFEFPMERIGGMGVSIQKMEDGFEVLYVLPNGPAAELGLEAGDIITEVNGETTYDLNFDDFLQLTTGYEGTKAEFRLKRDGKNQKPHVFTRKAMDYN